MTTAAVHTEPIRAPFPLRLGTSDEAFATARRALEDAGFTESGVCGRASAPSMYEFRRLSEGRARGDARDALDALIHLFLDTEPLDDAGARAAMPEPLLASLAALGLVERGGDGAWRATALLYPTQGLFIASDLDHPAVPGGFVAEDAVYPAITSNTATFLEGLPRTRCERFLEMCGGTGIAALANAGLAAEAWTADITERATRFAEFNARLNGLGNVRAVCGDLWEPVRGRTFDRIVAHPPYVAEPERMLIFRDGGPDGELITRGLLAGLPEVLEPGGRFYCTCIATDRTDAPLERRLRTMIGEREAEFDIVLLERTGFHPSEYYCRLAAWGKIPFAEAEQRHLAYRALGVERMVYCTFVVQRHAHARAPFTLRKRAGAARVREGDAIEWLLAWETANAERDLTPALLDARPIAAPGVLLRTEQHLFEGAFRVHGCALRTETPFLETTDCSLDAAAFLARCDGTLTLREHAERLAGEGLVNAGDPEALGALTSLVRGLVGAGCVDLDIFRAPR
ncbi:MAG TPA: methyltransferase [Gemmatimonadaceae bacterium]